MAKAIRKTDKRKSQKSRGLVRGGQKAGLRAKPRGVGALPAKRRSDAAKRALKVGAKKRTQEVRPRTEPAAESSARPTKKKTLLSKAELDHFRELLLAKRRELVGDMRSWESEALQRDGSQNLSNLPIHMADQGTDNYEQEFTLGLMEKDRQLLKEIDDALVKIRDGEYGVCEGTGQPISKPRLEAQPWARYSIEYARKLEQGRIRP